MGAAKEIILNVDPRFGAGRPSPVPAANLADAAVRLRAVEHAMRGSLGALAGAVELLRLAPDPQASTDALELMRRQVRQMTTQAEHLHDIASDLDR
jgi:hypothetical protein